jgi:Histidine kinase-, DNA gyrase B-, and HSP90-like ATPase/Nitrate and nitrite sensing
MKFSFGKLPLTYQWLLTGIIPLLALLYVSWQLYSEKESRVSLVSGYNSRIHESGELASLTGELETEAEYSLAFALNKGRYSTLVIQRSRTDKWVHTLEESGDTSLTGFLNYTFRNRLASARAAQDEGTAGIDVRNIMDFYHETIWQLSTSHTIAPSNNAILQPLHSTLESQRLLFEMATLLAITRNKIYLSVFSPHDTAAIISIAGDAWHTLKTHEAAFLAKASPRLLKMYNDKENADELRPVFECLDDVATQHQFDSTYTAGRWWTTASGGIQALHRQYLVSRQQVQTGLNHIYQSEVKARNLTLILLVPAILLVTGFFIFTVRAVNKMRKKRAAVSAKPFPGEEGHADDNLSDFIPEAIYRAHKTNGAMANGAANGVNGHTVPGVMPWSDKDAVPETNGKLTTNKQEAEWKRNHAPYLPAELNKSQENPASAVNDDLANYAVPKPEVAPVSNDAGSREEVVKENMAAKAEQRTDSLTSQMNELIDAAAIESGRFNYHKHIFKLNDLVSEMVSETGNAIPSYKISLRKNAALSVYGDRARIAQVLGNLLQNAIDHCPDADSIIVNLEEKGQTAVCSVEDFGNGIAKDQQQKIFEKFYRVNNTNAVNRPGLGLGLYIAIEIIKQHQGRMWVMSEPGLGSTFYFSLPVSTTSP